jgi:hypothetical protein
VERDEVAKGSIGMNVFHRVRHEALQALCAVLDRCT